MYLRDTNPYTTLHRLMSDLPIYDQLLSRAGHLKHYRGDLITHDYAILHNPEKMPVDSSWLWIVRNTGTHLARWDQDPHSGDRKLSHVEAIARQTLQNHNWGCATPYIFHVNDFCPVTGAQGWVTGELDIQDIVDALPRPLPAKPEPVLPGEPARPAATAFTYPIELPALS